MKFITLLNKINLFSIFVLTTILLSGSILASPMAFADKDEDKEKKDKTPKTFESECAKKIDKKKLNLDGFFCQVIVVIQTALFSLDARVTELEEHGEGGNPFTDIQQNIDDKTAEITQIQADMASISSGITNFQNQLGNLELSPSQEHACLLLCHANNTPCSCTYSDPVTASALIQQISDLQSQLDLLNEQLVDCQFELMVLQTLQNQLDTSGDPTPDCNDANLCTIDFFDSTTGMCTNLPNDGLSCNDGDVTTQSDMCTASMCEGTPIICNDGNPDTADSLDLLTGECIFTLIDNDEDGFGPSTDCNDLDSSVNPDATEELGDGIDNNCDGIIDNLPPIVNAGQDQVVSRGTQSSCVATFVGTASDPDDDSFTIQWSGRGSFDSPNSLTTDFDMTGLRLNTPYTITLTVNDGLHAVSDTLRITCNSQ